MSNTLDSLLLQARQALVTGRHRDCHQLCTAILKLAPKHPEAHFLLGVNNFGLNQVRKAIYLLEVAVKLDAKRPDFQAQLARGYALANRLDDAAAALNKAMALMETGSALQNRGITLDTLGVVLTKLSRHPEAENFFSQAVDLAPDNPNYLFNLASSLRFNGRFAEALSYYQRLVRLKPDYYEAYPAIAELSDITPENNHIEAFERALASVSDNINAELHLCHALAREYEALEQHEQALNCLIRGNSRKRDTLNYHIDQDRALFEAVTGYCDAAFMGKPVPGCDSAAPIFIIGMPRSGTTLVERILSNHSDVHSAGELQDFGIQLKLMAATASNKVLDIDTLCAAGGLDFAQLGERYLAATQNRRGATPHFIDKLPLNFLYAGYIHKAFPNARIICLRRNPMDTCVSNFRQLFAVNFSYYNYAYSLEDTAHYYVLFHGLIEHWRRLISPERFLEVHYENVVAAPETETRRLLAFCGLEWQAQCLEFHKSNAPVTTASAVQVRKPLYTTAVGRWKKYGSKLDGVRSILAEAGIDY